VKNDEISSSEIAAWENQVLRASPVPDGLFRPSLPDTLRADREDY